MLRRPPNRAPFPHTQLSGSPALRPAAPAASGAAAPPAAAASGAAQTRAAAPSAAAETGATLVAFEHHPQQDRESTRLNSSHANISYAVFCLNNKHAYISVTL